MGVTAILDDLVLSVQRVIDRSIRRLRRGAAPKRSPRRLLIVQIDGLSRLCSGRPWRRHVSFIPERGAHAGPSPEEMHTFIRYRAAS